MTASPTAYKLQLGATLMTLRTQRARMEREAAQQCLGCSLSKIVKIENGDVGVRPAELRLLLDLYGVTDPQERAEIEALGREAQKRRPRTQYGGLIPDHFKKYFNLEELAADLQSYDAELVHGLAQTEEYARAVTTRNPLHRPGAIEPLIQARLARQKRLTRPDAPRLHLVLSEGAIHREVGGPKVMADQLRHLIGLAKARNVTVQIVPFTAGAHASTGFPFTIINRGGDGPSIVYIESLTDSRFLDDPGRVAEYELVFRQVVAAALTPPATIKLLGSVASALDNK